jgi:hypothetical protein
MFMQSPGGVERLRAARMANGIQRFPKMPISPGDSGGHRREKASDGQYR